MEKEKVMIFDLDGTLYQTEVFSIEATKRAFKKMNLSIPEDSIIKKHFGEPTLNFCKNLYPEGSGDEIRKLSKLIRTNERKLISKNGKLYKGIKNVLKQLKELGYELAICSNGSIDYIKLVLSSLKINEYFSVTKSTKGLKKELVVKEILKTFNVNKAIVIGDTDYDYKAAKNNNLPCIMVSYGYGNNTKCSLSFTADNSEEIMGHINRINLFWRIENDINKICKKRILIGINGVDTSGKTKFTSLLKKYLEIRDYNVSVINLDDFHNPSDIRKKGKNEIEAYINNAFNLNFLEKELLKPIQQNKVIDKKLKLHDLKTDSFTKEKHYNIDRESIVILEGVLLYRESINKYFDYKIFLDIPFSEVINRAKKRDVPIYGEGFIKKYHEKYIPLQKRYLNEYSPITKSDLIIDNTDFNKPKVKNGDFA